jgi:hypothetical protein
MWGLDWNEIGTTLRESNYSLLLPAALALLAMFTVRAIRWRMLLGSGEGLDFVSVAGGVLIGYFGNFVLAANAGELVRTYVFSKNQGLSQSTVLASILVEKTLDVSVLVGFLLAMSLLVPLPPWMRYLGIVAGGLSVVTFIVLIFLPQFAREVASWAQALLDRVSSSIATRVCAALESFVDGTQAWLKGGTVFATIGLTVVIWPLLGLALCFVGASLGLSISRLAYLLLMTLITLGAILPALPGHVGTLEFLIAGGLAVFSVDREQALSFAILLRLVRLVPLSLGYVSLLREGLRPSDVSSL